MNAPVTAGQQPDTTSRVRWEYLVDQGEWSADEVGELEARLDKLGSQGWDLVSVHVVGGVERDTFKRQVLP